MSSSKNRPVKGLRGSCLSVWGPEPHPPFTLFTCTQYTSSHREGGGEELNQWEGKWGNSSQSWVENKSTWLTIPVYLQTINSNKHLQSLYRLIFLDDDVLDHEGNKRRRIMVASSFNEISTNQLATGYIGWRIDSLESIQALASGRIFKDDIGGFSSTLDICFMVLSLWGTENWQKFRGNFSLGAKGSRKWRNALLLSILSEDKHKKRKVDLKVDNDSEKNR
jgi:hypothetical protein